ncbi:MAG: PP2C family protein-serine/threonine phosphatase [Phycisphaerales bacterium]
MGALPTNLGTHAVTLITSKPAEHAQAMLWRPVADRWPNLWSAPRLQVTDLASALDCGAEGQPGAAQLGSVVLAYLDDDADSAAMYQLIDLLWEEGLGGLLLLPDVDERRARLGGKGVIVMDRRTDPSVVAAALYALVERQATVDALKNELRTTRRFQGGLRGQMEKIHEELELAACVQREFLPKSLPTLGSIDFQVLFRPAGYVSGDIYDVQRLDEDHVGFFLADAVGHGVPAALMTMVLSRSLTTKVVSGNGYQILEPCEVLSRLNREMVERHDESPRFATAVYGVIHTRTREVRLAGAGHPPPLLIEGEKIDRVETQGGLLGVFSEDSYDQQSFTMGADQALVLYSDGFETAFPAPGADEYGRKMPTRHYLDHFVQMTRRWRESDLASSFRHLAHELDEQAGSLHQIDDLTVMMIAPRVVPQSGSDLERLLRGEEQAGAPREAAVPLMAPSAETAVRAE